MHIHLHSNSKYVDCFVTKACSACKGSLKNAGCIMLVKKLKGTKNGWREHF